jgi:hypothetical protein
MNMALIAGLVSSLSVRLVGRRYAAGVRAPVMGSIEVISDGMGHTVRARQ